MARITVTMPDNIHEKVLKLAGKEDDSVSYTVTRLLEIGLMVMDSKNEKNSADTSTELVEYCQKLIIQMNGIIKEIAIDKFDFNNEKITKITNDTLSKFNKLKGIQHESL
jgi:hypothetical protein